MAVVWEAHHVTADQTKVSPNDLESDAQGSWRWKHPSILERTCDITDTGTTTFSSMSPAWKTIKGWKFYLGAVKWT
ncbi:uncharacterized protein [Lolium perenne]|uniref:uncharacterized protein n=1 Tax=Lolium perenne TaxID=4522 RepID=UPI003A9A0CB2